MEEEMAAAGETTLLEAGKKYISVILLLFILTGGITFAQSQGQWIMGMVTSISDNAFQVMDNSGKSINIGISQNTEFIHFGKSSGTEADFSDLTQNDIVTIMVTSQGGNTIALQVGFLHQGEQIDQSWQSQMPQNSSPQFNPYNQNVPTQPPQFNQYNQNDQQFNPYNNQYNRNDPQFNPYNQYNQNNNPQFNPYNQYNPNNLPDYNQDYDPDCPECNRNYQYNQKGPNMNPPLNPDNHQNNPRFDPRNLPARSQQFNLLSDYIKNNSTISDQSGVFFCELPSGWKAERGGIYIKEMSDATALCNVTVVPLKEKDMLSFAKSNDSNYEKLGKKIKNEYKNLGLKSITVSNKEASSLSFSYRGNDGNYYYVEEYYISAGDAIVTVHLETDRQKDFSADFRKIIENFQVK
ncbi:MAG: hypothetical protein ABRQ39_10210 [Candidatus Eremiobacterota bacterium]